MLIVFGLCIPAHHATDSRQLTVEGYTGLTQCNMGLDVKLCQAGPNNCTRPPPGIFLPTFSTLTRCLGYGLKEQNACLALREDPEVCAQEVLPIENNVAIALEEGMPGRRNTNYTRAFAMVL